MRKDVLSIALAVAMLGNMIPMLGGLSWRISPETAEATETSCESGGENTGNIEFDHCADSGCPSFLCISMNVASPFFSFVRKESVATERPIEYIRLNPLTKYIFHPPAGV